MAPVAVHASLRLAGQVGVHQGGARGGASARRDHPGGRTIPAGNHGELVGARGRAVVEIGRAAGLEGAALALGGAWVWGWKVGMVVRAAQRHGGGDGRGVGEAGRVVHPRARVTTICDGGEARELALKLTRERAQVRRTWQSSRHVTDGRQARASAGGEGGGGVDGGGRHGTQVGRVRLFIRPGRRGLGLTRVCYLRLSLRVEGVVPCVENLPGALIGNGHPHPHPLELTEAV